MRQMRSHTSDDGEQRQFSFIPVQISQYALIGRRNPLVHQGVSLLLFSKHRVLRISCFEDSDIVHVQKRR